MDAKYVFAISYANIYELFSSGSALARSREERERERLANADVSGMSHDIAQRCCGTSLLTDEMKSDKCNAIKQQKYGNKIWLILTRQRAQLRILSTSARGRNIFARNFQENASFGNLVVSDGF